MAHLRPRRGLLFVPGDQEAKLRKAAGLDCDAVIIDLEDAVAPTHKAEARAGALRALQELDFGGRERVLRINALGSPWGAEDVQALRNLGHLPDTLLLPKVDSTDAIIELTRSLEDRPLEVIAAIESARGLLAAPAIAGCPRVAGLIFGDGDYLADTGGRRTAQTLLFPRSALVAAAAAAGVVALDTPYLPLGDLAGLAADAEAASDLGFAGKAAIHPEQLPVIKRIFTPSPDRIAWAERVMAAAAQEARGVFIVEGVMADAMTVRTAQRILASRP